MEKNELLKKNARTEFNMDDYQFVAVMLFLVTIFSIRQGAFADALLMTLKQVFLSFFYGLGTVYLIIGMTKKMFKYDPTRVQIVRWAAGLAAFFAVSQFIHEGFLIYTGQFPGAAS